MQDHVGAFFGDHEHGSLQVTADHRWHDRCVHHAQAVDAVDAQPRIHNRGGVQAHLPGARWSLLLETLVDRQRFRGPCYRAANWLHVGQIAGRGRMDWEHQNHGQAVKDIYVYPLVRDVREQLCGDPTR
jgi:Domain of unknown function (DUF4338)